MGAAADMVINPFGAMVVGAVAGMISVAGYRFLTPVLERIGLRDTCGIHNLHALPAFLGAIVSAIAAGAARYGSYWGQNTATFPETSIGRSRQQQAGYQMAGIGLSIG